MQVFRFCFFITNLKGGGAQKAILNFADLLHVAGHQAQLILIDPSSDYEAPSYLKIHSLLKEPAKLNSSWFARLHYGYLLKKFIRNTECEDGAFDAVISTLPFADEVASYARLNNHWCRIANNLTEEIRQSSARKARRLKRRYRTNYSGRKLICVSEGAADAIRELLDPRAGTIKVIYNPIDFELIAKLKNQAISDPPSGPYILHAARFSPQKRHDILLKAFEYLPSELRLVLLCEQHPHLSAMIESSPRRADIIVAGFQKNPYPWFARAKLSVMCSDYEGMPNVIPESLACGTPIVSTDCPSGPREILGKDAPEALVPTNNPMELAQAIRRQLERPRPKVDISRFSKLKSLEALIELGASGKEHK